MLQRRRRRRNWPRLLNYWSSSKETQQHEKRNYGRRPTKTSCASAIWRRKRLRKRPTRPRSARRSSRSSRERGRRPKDRVVASRPHASMAIAVVAWRPTPPTRHHAMTHRQGKAKGSQTHSPVRDQVESSERAHRKGRRKRKRSVGAGGNVTSRRRRRYCRNEDTRGSHQSTGGRRLRRPQSRRRRQGGRGPPAPHRQAEGKSAKGEARCHCRRPEVDSTKRAGREG